jgi:hypothetical protein
VTKSPQVLRLEAIAALIRHRGELTDADLIDLLRTSLGCGRTPGARRAKRYRDARHASERDSSVTNVTLRPPRPLGSPLHPPPGPVPPIWRKDPSSQRRVWQVFRGIPERRRRRQQGL